MRACVFNAASDNIWVIKIGAWMGRSSATNATARLAGYETDSSKNPTDRIGYTDAVTVSTSMTGPGEGASYEPNVSTSDNGPLSSACMIYSGRRYAVAILGTGAGIGHSMLQAAAISADNEQFYNRTGLSQPPPDPFGAYSSSIEGHLTAWFTGYVNEPPQAPANGLAPTGTVNDTAPTFTANFDDLNGAYGTSSGNGVNTGDRLNQYKIQLRAVGTTSLLWNSTYTATSSERTANAVSRAYGGSALTRGTQYEWRIRMSDEFGEWGDYSAWTTFTPANLGFVTLDGNPTGKQEAITGIDFEGRWTHQSATSMKTVQVRLLDASGTVLQTGSVYDIADVTSSASPGTLFTVTWANTGFTTLAWGRSYQYQIRGNDGTQWSDWSASRSFTTNAAPTVPANLSPSGGTIHTALPLLTATFTDSDDTTATGLTATARITRPNATTVDVTMTYNSTTARWEFQTTTTQLNQYGTYSWKVASYDGTIYSGEATALSSATFSSSATFQYQTGPTVTVTSPADGATVTSASLDVTWTASAQAKYQVKVYADNDQTTVIYDSGLITSTSTSHTIPSGYLRNNTNYDLVVRVQDSTPLDGYSTTVNIAVAFTAPADVANFQVTTIQVGFDPVATAVRLSWDQSTEAAFQEYVIYRSAAGGPDATEIILARITAVTTTAFTDYIPASGYEYTYGIRQVVLTGVDEVESAVVEDTATVTLTGTVLSLVTNGGTYRAYLTNVREIDHSRAIDEAVYQSPAETKPVTVRAAARVWTMRIEAALVGDTTATAKQRMDELDDLDAQQGTICFRNARQFKRFCKIVALEPSQQMPDWWSVALTLREETFEEGEE